jgi:hypothetical protein
MAVKDRQYSNAMSNEKRPRQYIALVCGGDGHQTAELPNREARRTDSLLL